MNKLQGGVDRVTEIRRLLDLFGPQESAGGSPDLKSVLLSDFDANQLPRRGPDLSSIPPSDLLFNEFSRRVSDHNPIRSHGPGWHNQEKDGYNQDRQFQGHVVPLSFEMLFIRP